MTQKAEANVFTAPLVMEDTPMVSFQHVRKSFGHNEVLKDITFDVLPLSLIHI